MFKKEIVRFTELCKQQAIRRQAEKHYSEYIRFRREGGCKPIIAMLLTRYNPFEGDEEEEE